MLNDREYGMRAHGGKKKDAFRTGCPLSSLDIYRDSALNTVSPEDPRTWAGNCRRWLAAVVEEVRRRLPWPLSASNLPFDRSSRRVSSSMVGRYISSLVEGAFCPQLRSLLFRSDDELTGTHHRPLLDQSECASEKHGGRSGESEDLHTAADPIPRSLTHRIL